MGHHDAYSVPRRVLPDAARRLRELHALLVGVRCPLEVIMRRRDGGQPGGSALLGMHLVMFSAVSASLRQSLAPAAMLGRVHGAGRVVSNGGMLAGAALGGLVSTYFG